MQALQLGANTHGHLNIYATMVANGFTWGRLDFGWSANEASNDTFTWQQDAIVTEAIAAGASIIGIIDYSVAWANGNKGIFVPPTNYQDYWDYCTAVVTHYAPMGVHTWEVWNEPNIATFWQDPASSNGPNAANYARLLRGAYLAIKAADPTAFVLNGGVTLSTTTETTTTHTSANIFLQTIYQTIGTGYFDAFAYHAYGWNTSLIDQLYSIMSANGDQNKKIWITEYGRYTGTAAGSMSEFDQMQNFVSTVDVAKASPYIQALILYDLIDDGVDLANAENNYGLIRNDGTLKPSWAQFKALKR